MNLLNHLFKISPFKTNSLYFYPVTDKHQSFIYELFSDKETMYYVDTPPTTTINQAIQFISESSKQNNLIHCIVYFNRLPIGYVAIHDINFKHHFGYLTYLLHVKYRKQGLGTLMVTEFTDFILKNSFIVRIEAQTHQDNRASIKTLQKAGFTYEGVMRKNFRIENNYFNSLLFSKITSDLSL